MTKLHDPISNSFCTYQVCEESLQYIKSRIKEVPKTAIVCGSGLGSLSEQLTQPIEIAYKDIPNFPVSTVSSHKSRLVFGRLGGVSVLVMQGRFHMYEGYDLSLVSLPIRVMKQLGIENLILTNAAGAINPKFNVGDIMIINDHINFPGFAGMNPLTGPNDERFGKRFVALNNCYDVKMRQLAHKLASDMNLTDKVHEGVYAMVGGPNYETAAECRMLRVCGVDVIGMSTVPESITAQHCGMKVFAFSLVTNKCKMDNSCQNVTDPNHNEVVEIGNTCKDFCSKFVKEFVVEINQW